MSREEAAALVLAGGWYYGEEEERYWKAEAKSALSAADAHDAVHGVHRVSLDAATVERAARAFLKSMGYRDEKDVPEVWLLRTRTALAAAVEVPSE